MAERITAGYIEAKVERINSRLQTQGNPHSLDYGRRNDYHAIDLYNGKSCLNNLAAGTPREVYNYLRGFDEALMLSQEATR